MALTFTFITILSSEEKMPLSYSETLIEIILLLMNPSIFKLYTDSTSTQTAALVVTAIELYKKCDAVFYLDHRSMILHYIPMLLLDWQQ